jgi:hypothetical protein
MRKSGQQQLHSPKNDNDNVEEEDELESTATRTTASRDGGGGNSNNPTRKSSRRNMRVALDLVSLRDDGGSASDRTTGTLQSLNSGRIGRPWAYSTFKTFCRPISMTTCGFFCVLPNTTWSAIPTNVGLSRTPHPVPTPGRHNSFSI